MTPNFIGLTSDLSDKLDSEIDPHPEVIGSMSLASESDIGIPVYLNNTSDNLMGLSLSGAPDKTPIGFTQVSHYMNGCNGNAASAVHSQSVCEYLKTQRELCIKICIIGQHGIGKSMLIQKYFKAKRE